MRHEFDFFRTSMPESRKADFYLGCLDGCVFIDFNQSTENLISLCRISFDGYGCCNLDNTIHLDYRLSQDFIEEISRDNLNQEKITKIILTLIKLNKDYLE